MGTCGARMKRVPFRPHTSWLSGSRAASFFRISNTMPLEAQLKCVPVHEASQDPCVLWLSLCYLTLDSYADPASLKLLQSSASSGPPVSLSTPSWHPTIVTFTWVWFLPQARLVFPSSAACVSGSVWVEHVIKPSTSCICRSRCKDSSCTSSPSCPWHVLGSHQLVACCTQGT